MPFSRLSSLSSFLLLAAPIACSSTATLPATPGGGPVGDAGTTDAADSGGDGQSSEPSVDGGKTGGGGGADAAHTDGAGTDADAAGAYPAFAPEVPAVITGNGALLTNPKIVTVTWPGDPFAAQIDALAGAIGATSYWAATTGEYGVKAATLAKTVRVATAPAASVQDTEAEAWLADQLDGTHAEWGSPDPTAIYTLFYPPGTTIMENGEASCGGLPGAYHSELKLKSGVTVPYVLIPRCESFLGLHGIDYVSAAASHEWIEAATDPFPNTDPAFSQTSSKYFMWTLVSGGETGDMCTNTASVYITPDGLPFKVQRSWSNIAAQAGKDPCVPATVGAPYFNSVPAMTDTLKGTIQGQTFKPLGIKLAVGASRSVEVDLFSDMPTSGPWTVKAYDMAKASGLPAELTLAWDRTSGKNGDKLSLTITRVAADTANGGVSAFMVISTLGTAQNSWIGAVGD